MLSPVTGAESWGPQTPTADSLGRRALTFLQRHGAQHGTQLGWWGFRQNEGAAVVHGGMRSAMRVSVTDSVLLRDLGEHHVEGGTWK